MAWLSDATFRTFHVTESATTVDDDTVEECLESAKDALANLCGDSIIQEIEGLSDDDRKGHKFRRAQRKLAYRELLEFMSSRSRDGGIMESERDANGDTVNKYVPYTEIQKRRTDLYAEAIEIVERYFQTPDVAGTGNISITTGKWF